MKARGVPHQYACFACRKCFKRPQLDAATVRYMTSEQQQGQLREAAQFNEQRVYRCPDCGGKVHFMGTDFKSPKKSDIKGWERAQAFIETGQVFYRGSQDSGESKA